MNKIVKYILITVAFVGIFVLATWAYNNLDKIYTPEEDAFPTEETIGDETDTDSTTLDTSVSEERETADPEYLAPDFEVLDVDGNTVSLSDFFGKPIVLNFWATWCGPCKNEMPAFDSLTEKYAGEVTFLMVNLTDGYRDTVEKALRFVQDSGYSFNVYFDTKYEAAMTYGVNSIPMSVFIDEKGELITYHVGSMSESRLESYISKILGD